MIQIDVRLFSRFRQHLPRQARGQATVELPEGATVAILLRELGIDGRVGLVTINGEPEPDRRRVLHADDEVYIFPFVVGG
ncbi:MAG: MoaD/ThiS family protein [Anaerolineae bacterium]|jgi:sulfur carrier protein ThiS